MRSITLALSFFLLLTLVSPKFHLLPPHTYAATFTVNSLADTNDGTCDVANCTLREAIAAANGAVGADIINFSVAGTITLSSQLDVTDDLTINGSGITLDGGGTTRIMLVGLVTVALNDLTLQNGTGVGVSVDGGAIYNNGALTIANSTFSGNVADYGGAILNIGSGTLTIANSTFNGNQATGGGAIYNFGTTLAITNSIFSGNSATNGGGAILNDGTLEITSSTFSSNSAGYGGAIVNNGITPIIANSTFSVNTATDGGTILNAGTLTITSSTFSNNTVIGVGFSGGAISNGGTVTIINSTFSENQADFGGAISNVGTTTIINSTFSGNLSSIAGGTLYHTGGAINVQSSLIVGGDCSGTITDQGNNLSFNATNCPGTVANPQLGPLQNNGGPTDTMLPALAGPAVDAYPSPCDTATDQRGIARPQGSLCDIGATEQEGTIAPTDTPVPPTDTPVPPTDTPVPPTDTPVPPTDTPSGPIMLVASAVCVDENLAVTITAGDGSFNITASAGVNMPVNGVNTGTTTINGPEKWDDVTVTETSGDLESINLGQFRCRSTEVPVPVSPAHRARTTNPFPTFSWTGISIANNYRVFVFDDANPATRTVDIRQNSGGPTSMTLSTPLPNGRLFWRVRGRQNRIWSLWSIRFTLFKDPPPPLTITTPVPTLDLNRPAGDDGVPSPVPTSPPPPNSR